VSSSQNLLRHFIFIFFLLTSLSWQDQANAAQLQLSWHDNSNNEDGFKIERKTGANGTFTEVARPGPNVTVYNDTGLAGGATYCYRVRAFNSAGNSAYTPEGCATVGSTVHNFALIVSKTGTGNGTVTSNLAGINCGADCNESYPNGTTVTLNATPAAGSIFTVWSGNSDCTDGSVTVNADKTCTATFNVAPQTYTLNVNVVKAMASAGTGNGAVTSNPAGINCVGDCSESYTSGTVVALSAIPAPGSIFSGWSGSGCATGSVTMSNHRNCTATFNAVAVQTFGLTISKGGTGSGTVASSPAGINCGSDCSQSYTNGTVVALSATSAPGSIFSGWSGSGCTTGSVIMNASRSCTAVFGQASQQIFRIGVFRPNVGGWYFDNGNGIWDGCGTDVCLAFGMSGDVPVLRDYDGDGKADIAVYRVGTWYILRSSDGRVTSVGWGGMAQDMPVPDDYDGDGKADIAVYRDGIWYILRSSDSGVTATGWGGMPQDIPVPRDYDGDGKADIAVYRDGMWYVLRSSDSRETVVGWGGMGQDMPVPTDYDGDRKTDIAVYRNGGWYILRSSDGRGSYVQLGGAADDIPLN
jgi:Divergent InlB B-repeat domain/FG-GAP-like repeat